MKNPRQNRVDPFGNFVAHPARGTLTGNRGCLHDATGKMTKRRWTNKAWISCNLVFKNWTRPINPPGAWTQLFFMDDWVALSAGHRPCHTCRRQQYLEFQRVFGLAHPHLEEKPKAPIMDAILHEARIDPANRNKRTYACKAGDIPVGTFFTIGNEQQPILRKADGDYFWSFEGLQKTVLNDDRIANILTPLPIVKMLALGFLP